MPKVSGYVRFKTDWTDIGFTDHWGKPYPKGLVYIEAGPGDPKARVFYMSTLLPNGLWSKSTVLVRLEEGKVYPFTLEYTPGGVAHGTIAGADLGTLPAPTVELPFMVYNSDYYPNWWDVPEYQTQAVATGIGAVVGGVAGYGLKPVDPLVSAVIGVGLGAGLGYAGGYLATAGVIPIPALEATLEGPEAPARLGKYLITG